MSNEIENNKLIAVFMGWIIPLPIENAKYCREDLDTENVWVSVEDLKFHSSWDWLMPVIEKIESLGYEWSYLNHVAVITDNGFKQHFRDISFADESRLKATYNVVVEFIKWYNAQA